MARRESKPLNLRLFTCVLAAIVIGIGAYYLNLTQMYRMAGMIAAVPIAAYLFSRVPVGAMKVKRQLPTRLDEGEAFEVSLTVSGQALLPRVGLWAEDSLPRWIEPASPPTLLIPLLLRNAPLSATYRAVATKRGEHRIGPLAVESRDPVGFFHKRRAVGDQVEVLVYPQVLPIAAREMAGPHSVSGGESGRGNLPGEGLDLLGVRDYRPGDRLRRIDWKATARRGSFIVTEYEQGVSSDLVVALDLAQGTDVGEGRETTLEYGARMAASLANHSLRQGGDFALIASADGRPRPVTASTLADLDRVLEALARAHAAAPMPLSSVLAQPNVELSPDAALVLITAAPDAELLKLASAWVARRVRVIALLLDGSSFADGGGRDGELESQLAALAALGVAGHVVRQGDDLTAVLSQAVAGVAQHSWASGGRP